MTDDISDQEKEMGQGYEALFVPSLFGPWTDPVLDRAGVSTGDSVLDIGCGTGVLARAVLKRVGADARVAGLDPTPGMLATARRKEPAIDWHQGSAEALPFEDQSFDHVVSQFALMFVPDRAQAVTEMARVLKPGGKATLAVWGALEDNPAYLAVAALLDDTVSAAAGDAVRVPFCLGNPDEVRAIIEDVALNDVTLETLSSQARFPSTRIIVEAEIRGWLPLFDIHLPEGKIADVLAEADTRLAHLEDRNGSAAFQTTAHIVTASKA